MLIALEIENFRGFGSHRIEFKPVSIIVGKNNAGKSTLIEALRLVSIVSQRYMALPFIEPPAWAELPVTSRGIQPSLKDHDFNFTSVFNKYGEPPAQITAYFHNGTSIQIFIGPRNLVHCVLSQGVRELNNRNRAEAANLPTIRAMPQAGPLAIDEAILTRDYVRRHLFSPRSSLHFRNQLNLMYEHFATFSKASRDSWNGLRIRELQGKDGERDDVLSLLVEDERFTAEVAWMGHGLQVWLQTMWFLSLAGRVDTVVLDEPDVYLHADLQRKLIRLLRKRYGQVILATHSLEIINEVSPDEIIILDRKLKLSKSATSLDAVQKVVDVIGSAQNIQITRLWSARKMILVEGKDLKLLNLAHNVLFPDSEPLDSLPNMSVGGWSGWGLAMGAAQMMKNGGGEAIGAYCLFDSDYHTEETIAARKTQAKDKGISLRIWSKKEIENYFLVPSVIERIINKATTKKKTSEKKIEAALDDIAEELKIITLDDLAAEYLDLDRKAGLQAASQRARDRLAKTWTSLDGKLAAVSGKKVLSQLSNWAQRKHGVSLSPRKIGDEWNANEIPVELAEAVKKIQTGAPF